MTGNPRPLKGIAKLESQLAEAKAGWDSCIADLREAAKVCNESEIKNECLKTEVERLKSDLSAWMKDDAKKMELIKAAEEKAGKVGEVGEIMT